MKKNWFLFIIICLLAYAWMISDQMSARKEYEERKEQYEVEMEVWQERQERRAEERRQLEEEARRLRERAQQETREPDPDEPEASAPEATPRRDQELAAIAEDLTEREILRRMGEPKLAPLHEVDTPLYRAVFSELGAVPVRWEIKTSQFVTNLVEANGEATTTTMALIPEVTTPDQVFPLRFEGSTVREFNNQMYTVTREEVPEGTRLVFLSDPLQDGLRARKEFFLRHDDYVVDLRVSFENPPDALSRHRLGRDMGFGIGWQGGFGNPTVASRMLGSTQAIYSSQGKLVARSLNRNDPPSEVTTTVEWAGQDKKYFSALLLPSAANPPRHLRIQVSSLVPEEYLHMGAAPPLDVILYHASQELNPGETYGLNYQLYVGPKNREALNSSALVVAEAATPPSRLVFHQVPLGMGFLRPLCLLLLDLLRWLHGFLASWGLAIICTTLIVRVIIYPITHWSIKNAARTMAEQEKIRPELQAIMKKFKSDPMKRNQAMMALYREHNINPVAGPLRGCLPALLQMPIFLALYVLFAQSVELRGQAFMWIGDLSRPDALIDWGVAIPLIGSSLNILPILMGFTNFALMKVMRMPAADETQERIQRQMILFMPLILVFFLYHMPAGLTLYWTVSNIFSIAQSVVTKRVLAKHREQHSARMADREKTETPQEAPVEASSTTVR